MAKLKIGIIGGAGGQGKSWIRRINQWSIKGDFETQIVALCDRHKFGMNRFQRKFGWELYTDYHEMYENAGLDLVIIATPHFLHAPMAIAAAEHKINVLTEKPMCINLKQADDMAAAVEKSEIKLAVGFQHRFSPTYLAMKNAIDSGDLGKIFQLNMHMRDFRTEPYYLNSSPAEDPITGEDHHWRGIWATEGAGSLSNQQIHHIDVYQWLAPSPVKSITAISRVARHVHTETDDNTNVLVEFQDGSTGNLQLGVAYEHGREGELGIYGNKGALVHRGNMYNDKGEKVPFLDYRSKIKKATKPVEKYIPKNTGGDKAMFGALIDAINSGDPSKISVSVNEGRKSTEIMRAILLSVKEDRKITFPFEDKPNEFPDLPHTYKQK